MVANCAANLKGGGMVSGGRERRDRRAMLFPAVFQAVVLLVLNRDIGVPIEAVNTSLPIAASYTTILFDVRTVNVPLTPRPGIPSTSESTIGVQECSAQSAAIALAIGWLEDSSTTWEMAQ